MAAKPFPMNDDRKSPISIDRANIIFYCHNWQDTVEFYRRQLRLPVDFENDWFVEFRLTEGSYLSIADSRRATIRPVHGQGVTLTLRVPDINAAHADLQGRGVEMTPIRRNWGALVFYCHDPEGHRLEFWQEIDPGSTS